MKHSRYCLIIPIVLSALILFLPACASAQPETGTLTPSSAPKSSAAASIPPAVPGVLLRCSLPPVAVPTAAPIPGPAELDPSTGLHYTGSGDIITIDPDTYRLEINGKVDYPVKLRYDELRCLPKIEVRTTIVCKGNFDDTAIWAGASLKYVLELAGIQVQAKNIRLTSADGYEATVSREDAMSGKAFLAYEWEKKPVPVIHGFPVRAAFPGLLGANWVKWLVKIEAE